jgi:hypothetical protein
MIVSLPVLFCCSVGVAMPNLFCWIASMGLEGLEDATRRGEWIRRECVPGAANLASTFVWMRMVPLQWFAGEEMGGLSGRRREA